MLKYSVTATEWKHSPIGSQAGAPQVEGTPLSNVWADLNIQSVIYRGTDGEIQELWYKEESAIVTNGDFANDISGWQGPRPTELQHTMTEYYNSPGAAQLTPTPPDAGTPGASAQQCIVLPQDAEQVRAHGYAKYGAGSSVAIIRLVLYSDESCSSSRLITQTAYAFPNNGGWSEQSALLPVLEGTEAIGVAFSMAGDVGSVAYFDDIQAFVLK